MRGAGMVVCTKEREKTWPLTVGVETATHKNLGPIQLAHFWVSATLTSTVSEDGSIRLWYRTSSKQKYVLWMFLFRWSKTKQWLWNAGLNPNEEVEVVMEMEAKFEAKPNQKHIHKVIERKLVGTNVSWFSNFHARDVNIILMQFPTIGRRTHPRRSTRSGERYNGH